jgi:hypothetical protein
VYPAKLAVPPQDELMSLKVLAYGLLLPFSLVQQSNLEVGMGMDWGDTGEEGQEGEDAAAEVEYPAALAVAKLS